MLKPRSIKRVHIFMGKDLKVYIGKKGHKHRQARAKPYRRAMIIVATKRIVSEIKSIAPFLNHP